MHALYNEIEPFACDWLVNLERAGHIAPGRVERRSIRDLLAANVAGPGQRHFFAGIGVWSHALRVAGWPDDLDVWTGSCPCQPFSSAGRRGGVDDERHLWPDWFRLIRECRPPVVFGEQVASPDGLAWLDLVRADMEGAGYAFGAADLCAAGVGAPHIRQRIYFVALADGERCEGVRVHLRERRSQQAVPEAGRSGALVGVADAEIRGHGEGSAVSRGAAGRNGARLVDDRLSVNRCGCEGGYCTDPDCDWTDEDRETLADSERDDGARRLPESHGRTQIEPDRHGATRGFWGDATWLPCRDGAFRPTQPGLQPLAHGAAQRMGRLRAYGNAIVPEVAATFIRAVMDALSTPVTGL